MSGTVVLVAGSVPLEQLIGPVGPDQATRYGPNVTVVDNSGNNITPASAEEPVVTPSAVQQKTIKIQSPEHQLLLRTVPRVTMYGPDINLV